MSGIRKTNARVSKSTRVAPVELQEALGYTFSNGDLLVTALTHPTYINNVDRDAGDNNQRLEFLGDAVLGLLTAEYFYKTVPDGNEGTLTLMRSQTVSGAALAKLAAELDLGKYLFMDKGEGMQIQRFAEHTLACAFEAVIGAIWLDSGLPGVQKVFDRLFASRSETEKMGKAEYDPKGALQAFAQKKPEHGEPVYTLVASEGPDHDRTYRVKVCLDAKEAEGTGKRKRVAEAAAAAAWLQAFANA